MANYPSPPKSFLRKSTIQRLLTFFMLSVGLLIILPTTNSYAQALLPQTTKPVEITSGEPTRNSSDSNTAALNINDPADWGSIVISTDINGDLVVTLENSEIRVVYQQSSNNFGVDHNGRPSCIDEFFVKDLNKDITSGGRFDNNLTQKAMTAAQVIYDGPDKKTVQMTWESGAEEEVSIFPNSNFLQIDYLRTDFLVTDWPNWRKDQDAWQEQMIELYGADQWHRTIDPADKPTRPSGWSWDPNDPTHFPNDPNAMREWGLGYNEIYYDTINGDLDKQGELDPVDAGPLNYNGHFIFGAHKLATGEGYGRTLPVDRTRAIILWGYRGWEYVLRNGRITSYLYPVTGGKQEILSLGMQLVDGIKPPNAVDDSYTGDEGGVIDTAVNFLPGVLDNDSDPDGDALSATLLTDVSHGSLTLNPDGSFTYTHDGGETTADSFTYEADDGTGGADWATVNITINPVNDSPAAVEDNYSLNQGQTLTVDALNGVLANDTDADSGSFTAALLIDAGHGELTLNPDGSFTYIHDDSGIDPDGFTYQVDDGSGGVDSGTVNITVFPPNDPPIPVDDDYSVDEGGAIDTVSDLLPGVLDNDSDPDGDALTAALLTDVSHGTLTLDPDGSFVYVHDGSETTADSFSYEADDAKLGIVSATANITINPINDPPAIMDDAYTVQKGSSLSVGAAAGVLANDTDPENDPLTATLLTGVSNGSLTFGPDGSFVYTHDGSEASSDSFTYEASDGNGGVDTATVTIDTIGLRVTGGLLALYSFMEGSDAAVVYDISGVGAPLDLTIQDPANTAWIPGGGLSINADTVVNSAAPAAKIVDGAKATNELTIETWVNPANTSQFGPARIVALSQNAVGGGNFILGQGPGDGDISYDARLRTTATTKYGTPSLTSPNGSLTLNLTHVVFTRDASGTTTLYLDGISVAGGSTGGDFSGWGSYALGLANEPDLSRGSRPWLGELYLVAIYDDALDQDQVLQNFSAGPTLVPNKLPVASDDAYTVDEGAAIDTVVDLLPGVLDNDSDPDGDALSAALLTDVSHGTLTLSPDGSFVYIHDGGETTADSFTYEANDGKGGTAPAAVDITVNPINDPPVPVDDNYSLNQGQTLTVDALNGVLSNDTDPDSGSFTAALLIDAGHGELTLNPDGSFTYIHDDSGIDPDGFTYQVDDGSGGVDSGTVNITIFPVNDPPVPADDDYSVDEGGVIDTVLDLLPGVLDNDGDPDGDALTAALLTDVSHGSLTLSDDGSFVYTHDGGETTADSFTYEASDGKGGAAPATVDIAVNPINDPPLPVDDNYSVQKGGTIDTVADALPGVLDNDSDPDGPTLTAALFADVSHGILTLNPDGSFVYTHDGSEASSDSFTYEANDGNGGVDTATVTINTGDLRVTGGLLALYSFMEGSDAAVVYDISGVGAPLDLTIQDPANTAWIPGGGLSINADTVVNSAAPAAKIVDGAKATNELTIETWVNPANTSQFGPARIVALSQNAVGGGNFILGQGPGDGDISYDARLRTTATTKYGTPSLTSPNGSLTLNLTHVVFTRDASGTTTLYLDGISVAGGSTGGDFSGWGSYALGLANEPDLSRGSRPWLGELYLVAIYDDALDQDQVLQNFSAGPILTP